MVFYVSGTSVQLPVRAESMAASAAYGFRPSVVDGRGAFVVRRAAGEEDHRSGTARNAPGASGTLHPSNCPGGEHGLRFRPSLVEGRGALSCVAQPGKRIIAVEPPGVRRARVVRCIRPIARAANAVCGFRPSFVDGRGAFAVRHAAGEEDHRSGTARNAPGASGTLHPSNCPGGEYGFRPFSMDGREAFP